MARKILVGLVAVVAVGALAAVVLHSELADPDIVYVQIDNDSVHSIEPHGGMCYSYQLEAPRLTVRRSPSPWTPSASFATPPTCASRLARWWA